MKLLEKAAAAEAAATTPTLCKHCSIKKNNREKDSVTVREPIFH